MSFEQHEAALSYSYSSDAVDIRDELKRGLFSQTQRM